MEQFLAYKRAKLSGQKPLIQKALQAQDPVEAKSILNTLRADHYEEWKKEAPAIALEGLQAKFKQNPALAEYLRNTTPLTLGEASTNQVWGVGLTLVNENALDKSKWNKQGNLLGRSLMKVRDQLLKEHQQTTATVSARVSDNRRQHDTRDTRHTPQNPGTNGDKAQPPKVSNKQSDNASNIREGNRKNNSNKN